MDVLAAEQRAKRRHIETALLLAVVLTVTGVCGASYAIKLMSVVDASTGSLWAAAGSRR